MNRDETIANILWFGAIFWGVCLGAVMTKRVIQDRPNDLDGNGWLSVAVMFAAMGIAGGYWYGPLNATYGIAMALWSAHKAGYCRSEIRNRAATQQLWASTITAAAAVTDTCYTPRPPIAADPVDPAKPEEEGSDARPPHPGP